MYDECIVHGGFYDNFEYYYLTKRVFKDCEVKWRCITSHSKDDVIAQLEDKYRDINPEVYNDIEVIPHKPGVFYRDPLIVDILVCPTNSAMYWFLEHKNIMAAKTYIGLGDWKDIHPKQNKFYKNSITLADERIFDYEGKCNWMPYRKKILWMKYKRNYYEYGKYDYLLNLSLKERRFSKTYILDLLHCFDCGEITSFACYTGHKNEEYYAWLKDVHGVHLIIPPVKDFMELFRTFIYLPYVDGTDATPRLIPECAYYNKEIYYYGKDIDIKSGGYYRYKDTMELGIEGLSLEEDDEFIKVIEAVL